MEVWKDVIGYKGLYQVSSLGRVRSLCRRVSRNPIKWRILSYSKNFRGYHYVYMSMDSVRSIRYVSRIVAEAFIDKNYRKKNLQVNHKNGNKNDNRLCNLETVTPKQNIQHAIKTGLIKKVYGSQTSSAKLIESDVVFIRDVLMNGAMNQAELCKIFKINASTMSSIKRNATWTHVK